MKLNYIPLEKRDCPHCGEKNSLCYYREDNFYGDRYYCNKCYKIILWDGDTVEKMTGEAYPNRDK